MNLEDIERIIKIFGNSKVSTMDLEIDGIKIKLEKNEPIVKYVEEKNYNQTIDDNKYITAPLVGTYYSAPSIGSKPFIEIGSKVKKGDKVCIVEAMKVMNEITAPCDGVITEAFVQNGQMVEFGQKLFTIVE